MCKVSIIVPVYNPEEYFTRCIDSILHQSLLDIEIIIIDDGSDNPSYIQHILDEYHDSRIQLIHQDHKGVAAARNKGIVLSKGEYIGFVDSDDYIDPDMFYKLYITGKNTDADIVNGNFHIINENEIESKISYFRNNNLDLDVPIRKYSKPEISSIINSANTDKVLWFVWKGIYKNAIIQNHNIRFPEELSLGEETPFVLECMFNSSIIAATDEKLYYYIQRQGSLTKRKYKKGYLEILERLYQAKINVYHRYDYDNYHMDLNKYTMIHTIPMLLSNEFKSGKKFNDQIVFFQKMRESKMICEAYLTFSPFIISSRLRYLALLLKYRQYSLLALICR